MGKLKFFYLLNKTWRKNIVASSVRNERRLTELMVELKKLNIEKQ